MDGILAMLREFMEIYRILGDVYRANAYLKAIVKIKNNTAVTGDSISAKITEYNKTGRVAELQKLGNEPRVKTYRELGGILGVGPKTIEEWIALGILGLRDLRLAISDTRVILTKTQRYGLLYYRDLNTRIPREHVSAIGNLICRHVGGHCEIVGSYRRGSQSSGDIDVLMIDVNLRDVLKILSNDPGYIDAVCVGKERATFLYHYEGIVRSVDLLSVSSKQYACALLYFTGGPEFNERMRGIAKNQGYKLNQHGLYIRKDNALVITKTERDIFAAIGMDYVEPRNRV